MNTTEKGNKLEDFVYNYLQSVINPHNKDGIIAYIRKHKRYTMEQNDSYVADVSIDCYLQESDLDLSEGIDKPYIVYVFECKNYNHIVDKSDFQEFQNKIEHTRTTRVKGFMVTTSSFSKQTIESANYFGIGLIVVNLDEQKHTIIVSRQYNYIENDAKLYNCLMGESVANKIILFDNYKFKEMRQMLEDGGIGLKDEFVAVKYLKNTDIERRVKDLLELANASELEADKSLNKVLDYLGLHIEYERLETGQLGLLDIERKKIILSIMQTGNVRNFTVAHEIGHYILHSEALHDMLEEYGETETSLSLNSEGVSCLERQANHFASWLLLPDRKLNIGFNLFRKEEDIRQKYIFVDSQPNNYQRYCRMQDYMRNLYGVSWQAIEIRLKSCGLLRFDERNKPQRIGDLF